MAAFFTKQITDEQGIVFYYYHSPSLWIVLKNLFYFRAL